MSKMEEYKRFTVSLPKDLYDKFEAFRNNIGISRSDSIRKAMYSLMIILGDHGRFKLDLKYSGKIAQWREASVPIAILMRK